MEHAERYMEIWKFGEGLGYIRCIDDEEKGLLDGFMRSIGKLADEGHKELTGMDCMEAMSKQPTLEIA